MDELSIKEIVGVIKKRKWILAGFTAACMLASVFFSFFIVRPGYNAKITFNAEPLEMKSGIDPGSIVIYNGDTGTLDTSNSLENKVIGSIINQVRYPKYDIGMMTNIINGQSFKDKVYNELKLDRSMTFQAVCNSDSRQITIVAAADEQEGLVKACKMLYDYFPQYIKADIKEQLKKNDKLLSDGFAKEKKNIEAYKRELDEFNASTKGADKPESLPEDKQAQRQEIMNNYVLARQAFDSYKLVEKELDIIGRSDIDALLNVRVLSQDSEPFKVSPRIEVNVALGAVFGFMFCFIAVFFMEYWKKVR